MRIAGAATGFGTTRGDSARMSMKPLLYPPLTARAYGGFRFQRKGAKGAKMVEPSANLNCLAQEVVDAAFAVHKALGPGLLESTYEQRLVREFEYQNVPLRRQVNLPITYRGRPIEPGYRMDMMIDNSIIVEIKAVEKLLPIHEAQIDTYLKLSGRRLGFLINFNVPLIKHGIRRRIWSH